MKIPPFKDNARYHVRIFFKLFFYVVPTFLAILIIRESTSEYLEIFQPNQRARSFQNHPTMRMKMKMSELKD